MSDTRDTGDSAAGLGFAFSAYFLWGFLPIYLKWLEPIGPIEIVAHRIIWSVPVAGAVLVVLGRTNTLRAALRSPATLGMAAVTAGLITINWSIYVYAVSVDRALDAALGYYINPLFSVFVGAVFLGERLDRLQWAAIALAAGAVVVLTVYAGRVPILAIGLTLSWGFYALAKKQLPIGPNQGFLLEVLILSIPAGLFIVWTEAQGTGAFATAPLLLMGCGIVTAVPLLLYANGAKRLKLSTIGILQYVAPTLIMLVALFVFGEPFGPARAIAFPMIWAALALYSVSLFRQVRHG
ncbi:MAG: EamA family transporter RarD [Pseudomonadota bacterium]